MKSCAHTADCPVAAAENPAEKSVCDPVPSGSASYHRGNENAVQLCTMVCAAVPVTGAWIRSLSIRSRQIREKVGNGKVLLRSVRRC